MKFENLYILRNEIQNLLNAGSKHAIDNNQLKEHLPILKKMGEKAVVFTKLADAIQALLVTNEKDTAIELLNISILIESILQTMGSISENVEKKELLHSDNTVEALLPDNFNLRRTIVALRNKISDRPGIVEMAQYSGTIKDFRAYPYLSLFLDKPFPDLMPFVLQTVIPSIGKVLIPYLRNDLKLVDNVANANRLSLLFILEDEHLPSLISEIFSTKLPRLQSVVLANMGKDKADKEFLLSHINNKNKEIRSGVYKGLSNLNDIEINDRLISILIEAKDTPCSDSLFEAISNMKECNQMQALLEYVEKTLKAVHEKVSGAAYYEAEKFLKNPIQTLRYKNHPTSLRILQDLTHKLSSDISYRDVNANISKEVISCLLSYGNETVTSFLNENISMILKEAVDYYVSRDLLGNFFGLCIDILPKERVFDLFNESFKSRQLDLKSFYCGFSNNINYGYNVNGFHFDDPLLNTGKGEELYPEKMDPRWIDLMYNDLEERIQSKLKKSWSSSTVSQDVAVLLLILLDAYEPKESKRFNSVLENNLLLIKYVTPIYVKLVVERISNWDSVLAKAIEGTEEGYFYRFHHLLMDEYWKQYPIEYADRFDSLIELIGDKGEYPTAFKAISAQIRNK